MMTPISLKVTGILLNALGLVAPGLSGRLAFALFSSTRSGEPANDKERALFAAARADMAEATRLNLIVPGGDVATWYFPPRGPASGKTVLVVHGWGSRIDYLQALVGGLRDAGHAVVGLDLPGHGLSSGRVLTVPKAIEAIDVTSRQYGPFVCAIGHSFGGFSLVLAAAGANQAVPAHIPGRLALIASPENARAIFKGFGDALGFSRRVQRGLEGEIKRITGHPITHFAAGQMLAELSVPTLVVHAEDDKEVSPKAARAYGQAGPHVTLVWANGLGHRRIVSDAEVVANISAFAGGQD